MAKTMENILMATGANYQNLLDALTFAADKPKIQTVIDYSPGQIRNVQLKKVTLKAGVNLNCHRTDCHVIVIWLRGKAQFTAGAETFTMQPGAMLEMHAGTPHGALAETDCAFTVIKIQH